MPRQAAARRMESMEAVNPPLPKREVILGAATRAFLDLGYGAASMDTIARAAGVSKQTIYSHFGGKAALFEAIILERCDSLLETLPPVADNQSDPEATLRAVASRLLELMLTPEFVARFRVVMAESGRFPELAEVYYRSGPERATTRLADYLARLHRQGRLGVPDPYLAASQFFGMIWGGLFLRHVLGVGVPPKSEDIERHVRTAVRGFLVAHEPGR